MRPPPKILGLAHGSVVAALGIYLTLACAPVSQFQDPANGTEYHPDDIDTALSKASTPEGNLEDSYKIKDHGLITVYVKVYSQIQPQLHVDVWVTQRDDCFVTIYQKVQESGEESSVIYRFDKPGCAERSGPQDRQLTQNSISTASIRRIEADAMNLVTKGFSKNSGGEGAVFFPHADPEACDQTPEALANSHFFGLTSEKHSMTVPNCSQYPGCVTEFTRVQFDQIQNPTGSGGARKRCHHVYELSVKIPRIIVIYSHCQSYLAKQNDGSVLPVTACSDVTDFLAGQRSE